MKDYQELVRLTQICIFGRSGIDVTNIAKLNSQLDRKEQEAITKQFVAFDHLASATQLRELIKNKDYQQSAKHLTPQVLRYIQAKKLYC